jgi:hypothetical protein
MVTKIYTIFQTIPKLIINAALLPSWNGSCETLRQIYPNYDQVVFQTRQKIIDGVITIKNKHWTDSDKDFEPISCINTYTCCLKIWRRLTIEEQVFIRP